MAFTRRKINRLKVWDKYNETIKKYSKQPIIKKVDVEELKKQFTATDETVAAPKASKKKAAEETVAE